MKHKISIAALLAAILSATACIGTAQPVSSTTSALNSSSPSASASPTISVAAGPRAAKIIFRQASPNGSFDAPAGSNGTAPVPGSGHKAVRVFNADGSLLAQGGYSASSWPKWLTSFEIGLSGSANTSAKNTDCARFAAASEDVNTVCDFNLNYNGAATPPDPDPVACGAASKLLRVSEYDCTRNGDTLDGNGGPSDGVYLRATFSRSSEHLSSQENIMAVLEYASSTLNGAPTNPTTCFSGGSFTPTNPGCSDMTWQIYLKHNSYEVVQPYLMLVPPAFSHVNTTANTGGSGVATKQFYIPLAGDPNLSVIQISRIRGPVNGGSTSTFGKACNGINNPSNSALCVGMVFYSLTFFRI